MKSVVPVCISSNDEHLCISLTFIDKFSNEIKQVTNVLTNVLNCGLFFKVGQLMFKWTFLERENIVKSKTGLHLSLHGLEEEIMAITDW